MGLYEYQKSAVKKLCDQNLLLLDDMGLGKTIEACAALEELKPDSVLVICPKSMITVWYDKLSEWFPSQQYVLVRNYEDLKDLGGFFWDVVIIDEAHKIKNRKAMRSAKCKAIAKMAKKVWLLTGSPIMNRADEIWHPLHVAFPKVFTSYWKFAMTWCKIQPSMWSKTGIEVTPGVKGDNYNAFAAMLAPFVLRRTKDEVGIQLPPVTKVPIWLEMTPEQHRLHRLIMKQMLVAINDGDILTVKNVLTRTIYARRCAVSPMLIGSDDMGAKIPAVLDILDGTNDKVVIFSQWVDPLHLINHEIGCYLIEGSLSIRERSDVLQMWRDDPTNKPLLITIGTGGVGLTLTESSTAIFLDEPFNPAEIEQAIARLDRIGQTRPVTVYFLRMRESLEETMVANLLSIKSTMIEAINYRIRELAN